MASGIVVACLPVMPRFFRNLKTNVPFLRSLQSLFGRLPLCSRMTSDGYVKYPDDLPLPRVARKTSSVGEAEFAEN